MSVDKTCAFMQLQYFCVNKHKTTLLDGMLSHWSFEANKTLSNKVMKFIHSLQMSLRTQYFFMWRESSYQQKIMEKRESS
jgi:hypothetical protein